MTRLIAAAMEVTEGDLPDPDGLVTATEQARATAERFGPQNPGLLAELMPRVTPLDPIRPAQDLLEDLLDGIHGCWLLYRGSADFGNGDLDADFDSVDEEVDDDAVDEEFFEAVRAEAATNRDRPR